MNFKKGSISVDNHLLNLLNSSSIIKKKQASVLDLGCGQGRDPLFIARKGHTFLSVDAAQTGIKQILKTSRAGKFNCEWYCC